MSNRWVLVVDDEPDAREVICDTLEDVGCKAVGAPDGAGARKALETTQGLPCVIVLDLMMPGMNGWEFRAWQRSEPRFAKVPVVVLSAIRDLDAEAAKLEVNDYLQKPVSFPALLEKVERHCGPCSPA